MDLRKKLEEEKRLREQQGVSSPQKPPTEQPNLQKIQDDNKIKEARVRSLELDTAELKAKREADEEKGIREKPEALTQKEKALNDWEGKLKEVEIGVVLDKEANEKKTKELDSRELNLNAYIKTVNKQVEDKIKQADDYSNQKHLEADSYYTKRVGEIKDDKELKEELNKATEFYNANIKEVYLSLRDSVGYLKWVIDNLSDEAQLQCLPVLGKLRLNVKRILDFVVKVEISKEKK